MPTAFITGASGFIGRHLVERLREMGYEVTCLVRPTSQVEHLERLGARLVPGDVTDAESVRQGVRGAELVFHLAGMTMAVDRQRLMQVNEGGTACVAGACAEQTTPPTMVYVSSLAAAGPAKGGRPRTERDAPEPVSYYGRSKRAGEIVVAAHADRVPVSIVRPAIVFGEGDTQMAKMFLPISRFGIHMVPTFADRRYSIVHALDLSHLIVQAALQGKRLEHEHSGENNFAQGYYFAATDDQPTYAELGRMIGRALGRRRVWVVRNLQAAAWCLAAMSEGWARLRGQPTILNLDKVREASAGSWICSIDTAKRELGFAPLRTLAERLEQTAAWYRKAGWL